MPPLSGWFGSGKLVSQNETQRSGCVSVQALPRHLQSVQWDGVRRAILHPGTNRPVHSRGGTRKIFGETGTRVEDQPYHGIGSAALVASQCGTRTNERTLERSGSRNRRNVPERWGKKENGTAIRRIHPVGEPINGADEAHMTMIARPFARWWDGNLARYASVS